jgi:hypothetical protein
MEMLMKIVEFLVAIGVGITAVRIFLQVNRLWKRKHEKAVADSVSTVASLLSIFVYIPFTAKFLLIDKSVLPALNSMIILAGFTVTFLIGTGLWVRENRHGSVSQVK